MRSFCKSLFSGVSLCGVGSTLTCVEAFVLCRAGRHCYVALGRGFSGVERGIKNNPKLCSCYEN